MWRSKIGKLFKYVLRLSIQIALVISVLGLPPPLGHAPDHGGALHSPQKKHRRSMQNDTFP